MGLDRLAANARTERYRVVMQVERESLIKLFSYYRDAELRGAMLLLKVMRLLPDPKVQILISRHANDEMRHQQLWTERIVQEGGLPVDVPDGYQRRLGKALGYPRHMTDLFALTVVVEERAVRRYRAHEANPACDETTRTLLNTLIQDEKWHISWMDDWMRSVTDAAGTTDELERTIARYRSIESQVYESMQELERSWLGFSFSDADDETIPVGRSGY
jgi:rubrerythrin